MYKKLGLISQRALHIAFEQQDAANEPKTDIEAVNPMESIDPITIYVIYYYKFNL